jgi:hypothetical protein
MDSIDKTARHIEAMIPLASLIDELVTESVLQDYSLQTPLPIDKLLQNEEYIRGVLGIDIPLNESYPYSIKLQERILEEQLVLEGFFADAKKLGGDLKKGALALRYIIEDPGRIKSFMTSVYETVIKEPMEKIIAFCKKILNIVVAQAEKLAVKGWETVKKFFSSLLEKLETVWKGVQSLSGWKGALAVVGLGAAIAYIFSEEIEEVIDELDNPLKDLKKLGKEAKKATKKLKKLNLDKKKEAFAPALSHLLLVEGDEALNEFLGGIFGKKNKEAAEMGLEIPEGEPAPTDGILISPDQAKKAGIEGKSEDEAEEEKDDASGGEDGDGDPEPVKEQKTLLKKIVDLLTKGLIVGAKKWAQSLAVNFLTSAVGGGIVTFVKTVGKVFGGVKYVAKVIGKATDKFVSKIKDPKKEMEEMEKGDDDPTDDSTKKKEEKKESISRDEQLLREYIREKLLVA